MPLIIFNWNPYGVIRYPEKRLGERKAEVFTDMEVKEIFFYRQGGCGEVS